MRSFKHREESEAVELLERFLSYSAKGGMFWGPPSRFPSFERLNSLNSNRTIVAWGWGDEFVNILLQNKKTRDYVERDGGWTARADQARVFGSGLEAIFYCLNHNCSHMQISGQFADSRMNFTMPVTDLRGG